MRQAAAGAAEPDAVLASLQRDPNWLNPPASDRQRALARAYLQADKPAQSELELDEALANQPSYAPCWLDLAEVYTHQGHPDKAAAALVVATDWTANAETPNQSYVQAAQCDKGNGNEKGAPYAQALQLLAARTATLAQREAALVPERLSMGPDGKFEDMPVQIRKVRSSGHAALDNETLLSLSACSFKPLHVDGKPSAAWATVQYVWTID